MNFEQKNNLNSLHVDVDKDYKFLISSKKTQGQFYGLVFMFFALAFSVFVALTISIYHSVFNAIVNGVDNAFTRFMKEKPFVVYGLVLGLFIAYFIVIWFLRKFSWKSLIFSYPVVVLFFSVMISMALVVYSINPDWNRATTSYKNPPITVPLVLMFAPMLVLFFLGVFSYYGLFDLTKLMRVSGFLLAVFLILTVIGIFAVGPVYGTINVAISIIGIAIISISTIYTFNRILTDSKNLAFFSKHEFIARAAGYGIELFISYANILWFLIRIMMKFKK